MHREHLHQNEVGEKWQKKQNGVKNKFSYVSPLFTKNFYERWTRTTGVVFTDVDTIEMKEQIVVFTKFLQSQKCYSFHIKHC